MSELLGDKEGNSFQTLRIVSHKYDDSCTGGVAQTALPEGQSRFFEPPVVTTVDVSSSSFGLGGCLRMASPVCGRRYAQARKARHLAGPD